MIQKVIRVIIILFISISCFGQTTSISFSVKMKGFVEKGLFDPTTNYVDIAGTFNGWDGQNHRLTDEDEDQIYEIEIDGFTVGTTIEFKFRIDGAWDGREEFPNGGDNRTYTVVDGENIVSVWYNNFIPLNSGFEIGLGAENTEVYEGSIVEFFNLTAGGYISSEWTFENAFPKSSTAQDQLVKFDEPGTYDVTLIVESSEDIDTITLSDYITVKERASSELDWWNNAVFYEIFVRSFKDSDGDGIGDFNGLTQSLDYLNDGDPNTDDDLGITGIWLMPIHPSPSYHGYDVTDYMRINPEYGTLEDFETFLAAAHERGIKVIIDFVMNHTSNEHPWFENSKASGQSDKRNYYKWNPTKPDQTGPWGQPVWHEENNNFYYGLFWSGMPDLNFNEPQVKEELFDAADFWLNDVGIDGFRLDAVKYIAEEENQLEDVDATFQFWKEYQTEIKNLKSDAFSIGEAWTTTDKIVKYVEDDKLDVCFDFDMAEQIILGVNARNGFHIGRQAQKIYNVYPNNQVGTFLTNHDMDRAIDRLGSEGKMKSAAAIYLTIPGTPFIYYGEEIMMKGKKPDEFIRRPMQWNSQNNAGFSTGNPWINLNADYQRANVQTLRNEPNSIWNWYEQLINIRTEEPTLRNGSFAIVTSPESRLLSYVREYQGDLILVQINLSDIAITTDINVSFSTLTSGRKQFIDLLSDEEISLEITQLGSIRSVSLDPRQVRLLKLTKVTSANDELLRTKKLKISPIPSAHELLISIDDHFERNIQYDIFNNIGQHIRSGSVMNGSEISIGDLSEGIYLLRAQTKDGAVSKQFIKM